MWRLPPPSSGAIVGAVAGAILALIGTIAAEPLPPRRFLGPLLRLEAGWIDYLVPYETPAAATGRRRHEVCTVKKLRLKVDNTKSRVARDCWAYLLTPEEVQGKTRLKKQITKTCSGCVPGV